MVLVGAPFGDIATVFPDGWIAIARVAPYHIEWRDPRGKVIIGPNQKVPLQWTDKDKRAYLARQSAIWTSPEPALDKVIGWRDAPPPFVGFHRVPIFAASDGCALVLRLPSGEQPGMRYDVFNRKGNREGVLALSEKQHVAGFGAKSIYVVTTDDDGLQRITRHPWP